MVEDCVRDLVEDLVETLPGDFADDVLGESSKDGLKERFTLTRFGPNRSFGSVVVAVDAG